MYGKVVETPQTRDDAVPSAQPVRVREGLRLLADGELPRGVRHVRRATASCSTTRARAAARRSSRARSRAPPTRIKLGPAGQAVPRQPRRQARLGLRRRLRRGDVADAAAGQARRLRRSPPARRTACASSSTSCSALELDWKKYVEIDPRYFRPAEVDLLLGDASKAREKLGWKPRVGFKELVTMMVESDVELVKTRIYGAGAKRPSGFSNNQI